MINFLHIRGEDWRSLKEQIILNLQGKKGCLMRWIEVKINKLSIKHCHLKP